MSAVSGLDPPLTRAVVAAFSGTDTDSFDTVEMNPGSPPGVED